MLIEWSNSDLDEFRFSGAGNVSITTLEKMLLIYGLQIILDAEKPNLSENELDQFDAEVNALVSKLVQTSP